MYTGISSCMFCDQSFHTDKQYMYHLQCHEHEPNFKISCKKGCSKTFKLLNSYKAHISKCHSSVFKCKEKQYAKCDLCNIQCKTLPQLIAHLKSHIMCYETIQCPFQNCLKTYSIVSSFKSHIYRCHRLNVFNQCVNQQTNYEVLDLESSSNFVQSSEINSSESTFPVNTELLRKIGLFLLKLKAKYHITNQAIQEIVECTHGIVDMQLNQLEIRTFKIIEERIGSDNILKEEIKKHFPAQNNMIFNDFLSHHRRLIYFQSELGLIEPVEISLGYNSKRQFCTFQYVPLLPTLKKILQHDDVSKEVFSPFLRNDGCYKDITDGLNFKSNPLFAFTGKEYPPLFLLFYFDEFEICNPIGAYRKKHKLSAFYYILGNLKPHSRSNLSVIQLSILIRSVDLKYFGLECVIEPLIKELNILSKDGIVVPGVATFKGGVLFICGDNLGSNYLGGFAESFGPNVMRFCRTCMIDKSEVQVEFNPKNFELRTVANYDNQMSNIENDETLNALSDYGIKSRSCLYKIPQFHVLNGLPPDLMHDALEGIVPYEIKLVLKKLISLKFFTLQYLNQRIIHFKYGKTDSANKPVEQTCDGSIIGNAASNWCLLRLLPYLVGTEIPEGNKYWVFFLHLKYIVQLLFSPSFTISYISLLQDELVDHLRLFTELFPENNIKPKHHLLLHYPQHILNYGPPIRYHCFRFEAKHSYFKQVIHHTKQFKNPAKTLAQNHQLLQCLSHSARHFLSSEIELHNSNKINIDTIHENICHLIFSQISEFTNDIFQANAATIKGTYYEINQFLPYEVSEGNILFGQISFILFFQGNVWFIFKKFDSRPLEHFGVLQVFESNNFECIMYDNLSDWYPLTLYHLNLEGKDIPSLSLKHNIPDSE